MPKRKYWNSRNIQMQVEEEQAEGTMSGHLPMTPELRGKRPRRTSDVIDSMGDRGLGSPAIGTAASYSAYLASVGFVTPQKTRTTCSSLISPDQGYSTPEMSTSHMETEWTYNKDNATPSSMLPDKFGKQSVEKDADRYNMEHRNRGKCIIFNHENFDSGFETREGSSVDARRIEETFLRLDFNVEICHDYDHSEIMNKINKLSEEDHTDNDCLCIFVLTHGLKNDFICAKDVVYKLDHIWMPFTADRCRTLAGKPKLFFFQTCRGDNLDGGVKMLRSGMTEPDSSTSSYLIPTHADFLFAHSTVQGFFSWRNPEEGTWFVQSLCSMMDEYAYSTDLVRILTMTARKVATDFSSYNNIDPSLHGKKQVPSVITSLIRDVHFTPKKHYKLRK